jgi:hypothetical protein
MSALNRRRDPALRLASLLLLLSALGSLVLGMVRISFSPVFIAELQRFPGLGTLPAACVNGGIASYSGLSLATGGAPAVNAACLTRIQDAAQASLGVQPLVLVAVLAILGALGVTVWGMRRHRLASGVLSTCAAVLLAVDAPNLAGVFAGHFGHGASAVTSGPDTGLWVVDGLLLLSVLVQLAVAGSSWARGALAPLEEPHTGGSTSA